MAHPHKSVNADAGTKYLWVQNNKGFKANTSSCDVDRTECEVVV